MEATDLAIPILPCRSVSATTEFYRQLGFQGGAHEFDRNYAIFSLYMGLLLALGFLLVYMTNQVMTLTQSSQDVLANL